MHSRTLSTMRPTSQGLDRWQSCGYPFLSSYLNAYSEAPGKFFSLKPFFYSYTTIIFFHLLPYTAPAILISQHRPPHRAHAHTSTIKLLVNSLRFASRSQTCLYDKPSGWPPGKRLMDCSRNIGIYAYFLKFEAIGGLPVYHDMHASWYNSYLLAVSTIYILHFIVIIMLP